MELVHSNTSPKVPTGDPVVSIPIPPVDDDKYLTIRRSELNELLATIVGNDSEQWVRDQLETYAVEDAVVIRTTDVFAGPALQSYASVIALVSQFCRVREPLQKAADYFATRAQEADDKHAAGLSKLPD